MTGQATPKSAGRRSIGLNGRSALKILSDTVEYIRACEDSRTSGRSTRGCAQSSAKTECMSGDIPWREGLFTSRSIFCLKLQKHDDTTSLMRLNDWIISSIGCGVDSMLRDAPWGNSVIGISLMHLVHPNDAQVLNVRCER